MRATEQEVGGKGLRHMQPGVFAPTGLQVEPLWTLFSERARADVQSGQPFSPFRALRGQSCPPPSETQKNTK